MYVTCPVCAPDRQKSVSKSLSIKEFKGDYWAKCFHADQCEWNKPHKLSDEEMKELLEDADYVENEHVPLVPIPDDVIVPDFGAQLTAPYYTRDGKLAYLVLRYEPSKTFRPVCYTTDGRWVPMLPQGKFLYNADKLLKRPNSRVLVVEGEKTAIKAQEAFDAMDVDIVAVTWTGGCSNVGKGDWELLKDRDVVVWPDNDPPGKEAANKIMNILANL